MPNRIKGEVQLALADGRAMVLLLDMEALVEAEGTYGKPLAQVMADARAGFVGASRALLFGALRAHHPAITPREASAMLASDGEAVMLALEAAGKAALGGDENDAAPEGREGRNPPGKASGRNGAKPA